MIAGAGSQGAVTQYKRDASKGDTYQLAKQFGQTLLIDNTREVIGMPPVYKGRRVIQQQLCAQLLLTFPPVTFPYRSEDGKSPPRVEHRFIQRFVRENVRKTRGFTSRKWLVATQSPEQSTSRRPRMDVARNFWTVVKILSRHSTKKIMRSLRKDLEPTRTRRLQNLKPPIFISISLLLL